MSVIETAYVEVLPKTDGFEKALTAETSAAASKAGATASTALVAGLQKNAAEAQAALAQTAATAQRVSAEFLVGAASEAQAVAAAEAYAAAGQVAAKANVELALATGQAAAAADLHILSLRQEAAAAEHTAGRFRQQARRVAEGEASVGSLLAPGSLLKFGAGALAFGAVVSTIGEVENSLRVTGDQAFTTEGRLRNLGAALVSGNIIEGFHAINDEAATSSERLDALKKSASATPTDLRNVGLAAAESASKLDTYLAAQDALGNNSSFVKKLREIAAEERNASTEATALAKAFETSASAANDVTAAITAAGSSAAAFGEADRMGGQGARPGQGQKPTDESATTSTADAIARSRAERTKGLQDDLAQAKREAAQAATLERNQRDVIEGRAARHQATVEAETRVIQLQSQIDAQNAQARKDAATKRAADAKAAAAAEAQAAQAAATAYRQTLGDRELLLQLGAKRAELTVKDLADDRAAARKLIRFYEAESKDVKLTVAERRQYAIDAVNERLALRNIGQAAKKAVDKAGGASFSIADLYQSAVDQFRAYGSDIGGRNAILSPQDARGDLGRNILVQLQSRALGESEQQTRLLVSIDRKLSHTSNASQRHNLEVQRYGAIEGLRGTAMAAFYGYGVN